MGKFCSDGKTWFELLTRIICDTESGDIADSAYVFGQTSANQDSALLAAAALYQGKKTKNIVIGVLEGFGECYPGFEVWREKLAELGVPSEHIIAISIVGDPPANTNTEAKSFVRFALKNNWRRVYVVAPPIHVVRAFINTISANTFAGSGLMIYAHAGRPDAWQEEIVHSQCKARGRRKDLLFGELERIERYHEKADLVSAREILEYLDWRDAQKLK